MLDANVNSKKTLRVYLCCSPFQVLAKADDSSRGCPNTSHSGSPPSQEPAALEMSKIASRSLDKRQSVNGKHTKSGEGQAVETEDSSSEAAFLSCVRKMPAYVTESNPGTANSAWLISFLFPWLV